MQLLSKYLVAVFLLLACYTCQAQKFVDKPQYTNRDVVVKNKKLYVTGKEYIVKGMAYAPAPLGQAAMDENGFNGAGFCSPKKTVFNEYKSACFGSDYFDGVKANSDRVPAGPTGPWWRSVWLRDFPIMKELGVNTIRIYNLNPITKTFLAKYPSEFPTAVSNFAAEHTPFLDAAKIYGLKVMVPALADQTFLQNSDKDRIARFCHAIVDELGNHDALLMWVVTNEVDLLSNPDLLDKVNFAMDTLRNYTLTRWNRLIPTTTAVVDDPGTYEFYAQNLKVDLFTTNAGYRSVYFDPLFDGETNSPGWTILSERYNVPLLIGESGMHQVGDAETQVRPNWVNQQYKQILNRVQDGCIGLVYFEYNDEPLKPLQQQTMGFVNFTAAVDPSSGKLSTSANVWAPDTVVRKPVVFQALKSGLDGDADFGNYNFNSNEFELLGRSAFSIPVQQISTPYTPPISPEVSQGTKPINPVSSSSSSLLYSFTLFITFAYLFI